MQCNKSSKQIPRAGATMPLSFSPTWVSLFPKLTHPQNPMSYATPFSRFFVSFLIASVLFGCAMISLGQSGRRSPKPASPVVVEPVPAEEPVTPKPKPKPGLFLNVGIDQEGGFGNFPLYYYAEALRTIVERLRENSSIEVNDAGSMTRRDAVNGAKAEKEGYVVYVLLKSDMGSSSTREIAQNAVVEYWIFAPTTAKVAKSGHTYARDYQNKSILRPNTSAYDNYLVNLASQAAAEQILAHFHKPTGIRLPSPFSR